MMSDTMANIYTGKVFDSVQELNDFEHTLEFSAEPTSDDNIVHIEVGSSDNAKEFDEMLRWKEAYLFLRGFIMGRHLKR